MLSIKPVSNNILSVIRKKLICIFVLNVADLFFTLFLLSTGAFYEANPIMSGIVESKISSIYLKIIVPLLLLIYIYIRMKKATQRQLIISNVVINICLVFYSAVNIFHLIWTGLYIAA